MIGIDKDTDGLYYWTRTIDGKTEWLLNEENEKMPVSGVTPVMGVDAEGYWTISYDGGTTSSRVVDSEGNPVAALQDTSFFESVTYDDSYVYITLNDEAGTVIKLAKGADFYLSIKGAAALADFSYGQTKMFRGRVEGRDQVYDHQTRRVEGRLCRRQTDGDRSDCRARFLRRFGGRGVYRLFRSR